jgi:hypothetical protein
LVLGKYLRKSRKVDGDKAIELTLNEALQAALGVKTIHFMPPFWYKVEFRFQSGEGIYLLGAASNLGTIFA